MLVIFQLGTLACLGWLVLSIRDRFRKASLAGAVERVNSLHPLMLLVAYILPLFLAVGAFKVGLLPDPTASGLNGTYFNIVLQLVQILIILLLIRHVFAGGLATSFSLNPRELANDGARSVVSWLCVMPIALGLLVVVEDILTSHGIEIPKHPSIENMKTFSFNGKLLVAFSASVLAPLAEELFYRGLLQTMLRKWVSAWAAILITSAIFVAAHVGLHNTWPSLLFLSVVLGYSYERTGRLTSPILIHSLFNATSVVNLLFFQSA